MSIEVKVPQLPESVTDATVVEWNKQPGDSVSRDENLVDLETDKVVLEVPAPVNGVLKEILVESDTVVTSGQVLAIIEEGAAAAPSADAGQTSAAPAEAPTAAASGDSDVRTSPAVRRMLEEHNLSADDIPAGKDGRLTKTDVQAYLDKGGKTASSDSRSQKSLAVTTAGGFKGAREARRVPMTRIRKKIAERLVQSKTEAAILTSFNEVDLTEVMALRAKYKEKFVKDHGVKLGFMSFFVKAAAEALKKFPVINASVEGDDIIYHDYCDVGVAVSTPRGLMVPVLRDVEHMSFAEVEQSIVNYATQARDGNISLDVLQGGTFTVTNGGTFGSLISTPIINPPQSAILGMHNILQRPMVVDGEIKARPMMYIALSYDHRIIDGREAVLFLVTIKNLLEDPARLMLNI